MDKKLCGTILCYDGNKYDYCFKEAIQCLLEFCEYVVVVSGGEDNTHRDASYIASKNFGKVKVILIAKEHWESKHGKEKLNYFTNIAIDEAERLGYKYQFNLQADEIIHEKSYDAIKKSIETGQEAFMCSRINLWQSPYLQLSVEQKRKPCSTEIIRLAKTNYRSVDDAENLGAPANFDFLDDIRIYHMGFVRDRKIMKSKIINIQENIFETHHDKKLDGSDIFVPERWFSKEDLKPIDEPLPKLIQEWAKKRVYE